MRLTLTWDAACQLKIMSIEELEVTPSPTPYAEVPVIDLTPFTRAQEFGEGARADVIGEVLDAVSRSGFMYIVGHGIPEPLVGRSLALAREFFEQSAEVKLRCAADTPASVGYSVRGEKAYTTRMWEGDGLHFKEIFNMACPSGSATSLLPRYIYPETPAHFRRAMEEYYFEVERLERILLRVLTLALARAAAVELPADFLEREKGNHRSLLRLNYYRKCDFTPRPGAQREPSHTDWSPITILLTEKEGLEILQEGRWLRMPCMPGALVTNIGDQLHWLSNGRFKSATHRVSADGCRESSRLSFAYFVTESVDVADERVLTPLCAPGESPRFEPVSIKKYLLDNFRALEETE